jgi:hypothetical protein
MHTLVVYFIISYILLLNHIHTYIGNCYRFKYEDIRSQQLEPNKAGKSSNNNINMMKSDALKDISISSSKNNQQVNGDSHAPGTKKVSLFNKFAFID